MAALFNASLNSYQINSPGPSHQAPNSKQTFSDLKASYFRSNTGAATDTTRASVVKAPTATSTVPGKYIGIADLPNQVLGDVGVGKSTLINSLFGVDVYGDDYVRAPPMRTGETVQVERNVFRIEAKGVRILVNVLDVPNFGQALDNSTTADTVGKFIDQQLHEYFEASHQKRSQVVREDGRVHCCLYVISPTGHGLRPLDIATMKSLGVRTNLIPVIGRADSLTMEERETFKETIRRQLKTHEIQVYYFPSDEDKDDSNMESTRTDEDMANLVPFAVIGGNTFLTGKDGAKIRVRRYPWGTLDVEDPKYSDLNLLRRLLLFHHLPDLVGITDGLHYSNYVREFLSRTIGPLNSRYVSRDLFDNDSGNGNGTAVTGLFTCLDRDKADSDACIAKLEKELQVIFDQKVQEKMRRLDESAHELAGKYAEWDKQLLARKRKLRQDREDYERQKIVLIQAYPQLQERLNVALQQAGLRTNRQ
ncbi:Protein peanut [Hypsibius exemplaris]|uniref:Protein peanut n=1 Tax=Hypsibius exemplaris TaxID=2072580 RepID=A0A1W0WXK6_HYPEX|nr:Protein peanut [Hypsibius exemplaris]